jgi:regulator of sirC expression with transglutaminase-like and TPR domain
LEFHPDPQRALSLRASQASPRLTTLEALLDDPSPAVWRGVRSQLEGMGSAARPTLRSAARGAAPRARARARAMLLASERKAIVRRLASYVVRERVDLERGLFLLARFEDPRLDLRPVMATLDALGAELSSRVEDRAPDLSRSLELVRFLGEECKFDGEREDYHHPDNVHLHRALQRRRGLPLTLCAIYLLVARRARIQASALPLPGHVVLRVQAAGARALIDPFRQGARISERDCLAYLARRGLPFKPQWFSDASDRELLERQVRNLRSAYARRGLGAEVDLLELVLAAFERRGARP